MAVGIAAYCKNSEEDAAEDDDVLDWTDSLQREVNVMEEGVADEEEDAAKEDAAEDL